MKWFSETLDPLSQHLVSFVFNNRKNLNKSLIQTKKGILQNINKTQLKATEIDQKLVETRIELNEKLDDLLNMLRDG